MGALVRTGGPAGLTSLGLLLWILRLARLHRSVSRYAEYWSAPRGEPDGLLYVALGDSAAQGIGASTPARGYVGLLADRLRSRTGQPVQVVNLSRSGATLKDVLTGQLPQLAALQPDVVSVAVGGNDMLHPATGAFHDDVAELLRQLPPGTLVADVPYFMHGHWERDADQAARDLARQTRAAGLVAVPLHAALQRLGWKAMATHFAADWFHPNDRGHRVWADTFWAAYEGSRAPG
ncbi:MAG: SGNH/GDSL hydrolase family protein [Pseudorhodobacter sp.]|nr:SGNH/GDSL hydrolase family protein [Frankiaceae bacterium]